MSWITKTGTHTQSPSGFLRLVSKLKKYANGNYGTPSTASGSFKITITDIPTNATVTSATARYHLASPRNGYVMTCCGKSVPSGVYSAYTSSDIKSLFSDSVAGVFAIPFTFRASYSDGYADGATSEQVISNFTITVNYTYQEWQDDTPSEQSYTGTTGATASNFQLKSTWTRNSNGVDTTPTTARATKTFTISGIPEGATVTSALLSVTCKNSVCGPDILTCNGKTLYKNFDNVLDFTSYVTGNGTYSFEFVFKENGGCLLTTGKHEGVMQFENISLDVTYQYIAESESEPAEAEVPDDSDLIGKTESTGICLYSADVTDFSDNGYGILRPARCIVTEEAGGMYEAEMQLPAAQNNDLWEYIGIGSILKIPVPVVTLDAFKMAAARYWRIKAGKNGVKVTSKVPTITRVANTSGYSNWSASTVYYRGNKVKYNGKVWQYTGFTFIYPDGTKSTTSAPGSASYWKNVTSYSTKTNAGETLETLNAGTVFTKISDVNSNYMRIKTASGAVGYIETAMAEQHSTAAADVEERSIRSQCFRVYRIEKDSATRTVTVNARHLSYDFNNTILGKCEGKGLPVQAAIEEILAAALEEDNRQIYTDITDETVDLDASWDTGTSALINPDTGIVPQLQAKLIRDNYDFFIFADTHDDNGYMITYGKNMKSIRWTIDTTDMCTRVYPHCKDSKDYDLMLPEQNVDSPKINDYPLPYVESLAVNCKEGSKGTVDGQEVESLTKAQCYQLMREAAAERFEKDHGDEPDIQIDIDLVELRTTEEYKAYEGVERLYMYDTVHVSHPLISVDTDVYMTGYTYDAIRRRYETIKLTNAVRRFGEDVSSYQLKDNSIRFEKLSSTAVDRLRS